MGSPFMKSAPEGEYTRILSQTLHAVEVAKQAAAAVAAGIATGTEVMYERVRVYEDELDTLDREINENVTVQITKVTEVQARELLACLKFIIELERVGDLLLNFVNRAKAVQGRIEQQDVKELTMMATILEKMLGDVYVAFSTRDLKRTLIVLRADAELDRLRNLMFLRHVENREGEPRQESFHLVFMTQILERAGDHVKNLAEEVCHLVSGRSIRHLLRASDKPFEEMFVDWMRRQEGKK